MATSIYDAMGGADAVRALAQAWHRRCLDDPILAHAFEQGTHPAHTERLAAYWAEQLGGPTGYTDHMGTYTDVIAMHAGNGPHEQMDGRAVAAFTLALDDAGVPTALTSGFNRSPGSPGPPRCSIITGLTRRTRPTIFRSRNGGGRAPTGGERADASPIRSLNATELAPTGRQERSVVLRRQINSATKSQ